jgi:quercetin dioxygenase-like cupin family protein
VVRGGGEADLAGRTLDYAPGALMIIPRGTPHSIVAGDTGMVLMALFSPAVN